MGLEFHPLITVLIAAYNCADSIVASVTSVLDEHDVALQVVVVDDASTDMTLQVLDWLATHDERVTVVHREINGGEGPCRATGMSAVCGEWLLILDADDLIVKGSLAELAPHLRKTKADVVLSSHYRYDVPTQVRRRVSLAKVGPALPEGSFEPDILCDSLLSRVGSGIANKVFRMESIRSHDVTFQDLPRIGDVYFTFSALTTARLIEFIDIPHYCYRVRLVKSLTHAGVRFPLSFAQACYGLQDYLLSKGIWNKWRISFLNWVVALLPYNLSMMESYDSCYQLAKEFYDYGFSRLEFGCMESAQCLHPKRFEVCRILYEQGPDQGIYALMRLNSNDFENMEMRYWQTQNALTNSRTDITCKNTRIKSLEDQMHERDETLDKVWNSVSMRIGRSITWAPRKLRDLISNESSKNEIQASPRNRETIEIAIESRMHCEKDPMPLATFIVFIPQNAANAKACLESIAAQDCPDFEVLLLDVGMMDTTRATVDKYISMDKRFCLIETNHEGLVSAAAVSVETARGEWLCFVRATDYLYPEYLGCLIGLSVGEGSLIGTCTPPLSKGNHTTSYSEACDGVTTYTGSEYISSKDSLGGGERELAWGKVFHRSLFDTMREKAWFKEASGELYCTKILDACDSVVESGHMLYLHR